MIMKGRINWGGGKGGEGGAILNGLAQLHVQYNNIMQCLIVTNAVLILKEFQQKISLGISKYS